MIKILITRHGETDYNKLGLIQGSLDIPLNKKGINDALKLKKRIDLKEIDICLSSPLKRAYDTALILTDNKISVICDDLLVERNFGKNEGKKNDLELCKKDWCYCLNNNENTGESLAALLERAREFLNKIKTLYNNKTILIVSHGSFIKALHYNIIGYDKNTDFLSFNPKNTYIYEYTIK